MRKLDVYFNMEFRFLFVFGKSPSLKGGVRKMLNVLKSPCIPFYLRRKLRYLSMKLSEKF